MSYHDERSTLMSHHTVLVPTRLSSEQLRIETNRHPSHDAMLERSGNSVAQGVFLGKMNILVVYPVHSM